MYACVLVCARAYAYSHAVLLFDFPVCKAPYLVHNIVDVGKGLVGVRDVKVKGVLHEREHT